MTPGTYLGLRRMAAGLSVAEVAARIATEPRYAEHVRAEWIATIEADEMPATFRTIVALKSVYPFDIAVLARLVSIALGDDIPAPRICRVCGCSAVDACRSPSGPCGWFAADLCTSCAPAVTEAEAV